MRFFGPSMFLFCVCSPLARSSESGSAILSAEQETSWWDRLTQERRDYLSGLFEPAWFDGLKQADQIAYSYVAESLYDFLGTGIDSHSHDSYISFAPLLFAGFLSCFRGIPCSTDMGGTNGGTIFVKVEIEDEGNSCIDIATTEMFKLFQGSEQVSLADAMVIAGSVALDTMHFPRMDLVRITGGRRDIDRIAFRERLPSADDNPLRLFTESYNLSVQELVALVGGGHKIGAAHGVCTGYVGQWTTDPLSWVSPVTGRPEFFVDLIRDDWRWYEVCTFKNGTSIFESIQDPFADPHLEKEEEEENDDEDICAMELSETPFICEEQAMRGCEFPDGAYSPATFPCDMADIQFRLKADFFLKIDLNLRPYAAEFAANDELFEENFGRAYHKMTHAGLYRCGLSGSCAEGSVCHVTTDPVTSKYLASQCLFDTSPFAADEDEDEEEWTLGKTGSVAALVAIGLLFLCTTILAVTQFLAVK